ncbi:hypothetical protein A2U01_0072241, partial [Trifolium medium]|nr:hypothetical protein [Trifolium medium]
ARITRIGIKLFLRHAKTEEVMRVVDLDSSLVLGKWPLDLVGDTSVNGKSIVSLPETNNGEIADRELEAVLLINKVENGAGNLD